MNRKEFKLKQTSFEKQIKKDNKRFGSIKLLAFLKMKLSFGKKREQRYNSYTIYEDVFSFEKDNNGLPEKFYYKPTDMLFYDLIRKEDLQKAKKGLVRLFKKCYSHKYLSSGRTEEDIDELVEGLDNTLHSGKSWHRIGRFGFDYDEAKSSFIDCFDIRFHNFSSSYVAIEMRVLLSEQFVQELSVFIKEMYEKPGNSVRRFWGKNRKKSGAKLYYGVSSGTADEWAKCQLLYEQLLYVKKLFFEEIIKYLPIMQYPINGDLLGINVFETNISPYDKMDEAVYIALGINERYGFYFSEAERLYVSTETIYNRFEPEKDMIFIYNPSLIKKYEAYVTAHNKAIEQLTSYYMARLYRMVLLKDIGIKYKELISDYRNAVNECKISKGYHKRLLKLKYGLNRDFYEYKKIDEELPVHEEIKNANEYLENNIYTKRSIDHNAAHPYKLFVGHVETIWKQVGKNYLEIEHDLDRKIEVSSSLSDYSKDNSNRNLAVLQLIIASVTFVLLIFPNKATELANAIKYIWHTIVDIFGK